MPFKTSVLLLLQVSPAAVNIVRCNEQNQTKQFLRDSF